MSRRTTPTNEELIAKIDRLAQSYDKWMRLRLGSQLSGITEARLKLLLLLQSDGPQKMSALANAMGVAARTLTALVDGLEKDGLARRSPHVTDRRATMIEITNAGAAVADAKAGPYWAAKGFLFDSLSDEERVTLFAVYDRWCTMVEDDYRASTDAAA